MISTNDNGVLKVLETIPENVNGVLKEQFIIHANDAGVLRPIFGKKWEPPETLTWSSAGAISDYTPSENGYKCSLITHDLSDGTYAMYVEFTLPDKFRTLVTVSPWDYTAWHAQSSAFDQTTGHVISSIEEAGTSLYIIAEPRGGSHRWKAQAENHLPYNQESRNFFDKTDIHYFAH